MRKMLEGVRVVQLANFVAAAATGRFLADHGAEVIIVEPEKGDPIRYMNEQEGRPFSVLENTSWEYLNGCKKGLSVNTKTPEGKAALLKLLETTDVLITNWRLAALQRAGLDYDTLKEKYPRLVYSMILGYGKTGPDKDLPGFDFTAFYARGGYAENMRRRGQSCTWSAGLGDNNTGLVLAAGIMTALYTREKTGEGDLVTASLYETAIFNQSVMMQSTQYEGSFTLDYPITKYEDKNPFNSSDETKEGRLVQCSAPAYNDKYEAFVKSIGREDLIGDERFFPQVNMLNGHREEFIREIEESVIKLSVDEFMDNLKTNDIPHSLCYSWKEIMDDPQAKAIGAFYEVECSNGAKRQVTHTPVRFESEGELPTDRAPLIGENSREILKSIGYSDADVDKMIADGVLYESGPSDYEK